ncbi:i-AAA protease complex subunit Mgr1 [Suhomyces tanzawaensis NRRL Y-17324]|uniref:I-AAA protease complex subunit Mgr1 n=1 Tax=Suhomyces tanzawaensis NRRL Y-17324 TaxID=984487 RepID=A0A1E4SC56_9ASCO|nr:i-AAA protease complex subunit Mgr1 [Suhomyces tanzawaensis NRRL Y-17324]ODV77091.1 i-AAA protease complex subunit Mgr1 [Suhomyces tanzawaensis NRRL Y-17324]
MGVYIPPPNDDDNDKQPSGSGSGSSSSGTTIVIPNPASWIPRNPSVGLMWGPLTPASDNLPALYFMIGLQVVLGMVCMRKARHMWRPVLHRPGYPQQLAPKRSLWKALVPGIAGTAAIFGAGLEITRMTLPYDPWYDEAKYYRKLASKNGDKPSLWFGAYKYYRPMDMNTWTDKVGAWIESVEKEMVADAAASSSEPLARASSDHKHGSMLAQLNRNGKYTELYARLAGENKKRQQTLLEGELKEVNELNKAGRIDLILEGKSPYVNPYYNKPHIQLGHHTIDSDDDFEMVWLNFEPWDELKLETDYDIRLIPRWRWGEEEA